MTNYREISEKAFQAQVTGLAQLLGWHWVHIRHSPEVNRGVVTRYTTPTTGTLGKGWFDLILVREKDRRLIFAELKSEIGRVSEDQKRVHAVLSALVPLIEVYVWRPSDIEAIESILRH